VDYQSVTLTVWLGIAVLALVGANITLWRTRRHLRSFQQNGAATQIGLAKAAAAQQSNPAIAS